jgi:hypothetical protein
MYKTSTIDEEEILKLVEDRHVPVWVMLQWWLAKGEDILTANNWEIVVSKAFFHRGFGILRCNFFCSMLNYFKIELVYLNPNSILQVVVFVYLCIVCLGISPHFALFTYYFFLKYHLCATKHQVIGRVGLQAHANHNFLYLPLKASLEGWHTQWFYCGNHKSNLAPFVDWLREFEGSWIEEPTIAEMSQLLALAKKVSKLKRLGLRGINVAANWKARVTPQKFKFGKILKLLFKSQIQSKVVAFMLSCIIFVLLSALFFESD